MGLALVAVDVLDHVRAAQHLAVARQRVEHQEGRVEVDAFQDHVADDGAREVGRRRLVLQHRRGTHDEFVLPGQHAVMLEHHVDRFRVERDRLDQELVAAHMHAFLRGLARDRQADLGCRDVLADVVDQVVELDAVQVRHEGQRLVIGIALARVERAAAVGLAVGHQRDRLREPGVGFHAVVDLGRPLVLGPPHVHELVLRPEGDAALIGDAGGVVQGRAHWQASQFGLSIEQKLVGSSVSATSPAGSAALASAGLATSLVLVWPRR